MMVAKREHSCLKNNDSSTGGNRAHIFLSLLRAVNMIKESPSSGPLAASAQDSLFISVSSLPALTSAYGVRTRNTSSATSTTTIKSIMPYDSKADKHLGSHVVFSELSTGAPPIVARAFSSSTSPEMLRALSPMLAASGDRPQQHQQAQQQHDRATSAATRPGQIFTYYPPSMFRASIKNNHSSYHFDDLPPLQKSSLPFPSSASLISNSAAQPISATEGLLRATEIGQSQTVFATHMKGTTEAATLLQHYKKNKISFAHHDGAASAATTATLPSATATKSRACTAATSRGLAMPAGALATSDVRGVSGRKGKERNGEAVWKEGARTYESLHHQARPYQTRGALPAWTSPS